MARDCVHVLNNVTVDHIMDMVVCWPTDDKCREMSDIYQDRNGFPNIIGFLDGIHISIHKPRTGLLQRFLLDPITRYVDFPVYLSFLFSSRK